MRGSIRRFLTVALTCLPLAAQADPCAVVRDLRDIYKTMDTAHAAGGRLGAEDARRLIVAGAGISADGASRALQDTPIAAQAAAAVRPLRQLQAAGVTRVGDQVVLSGLERVGVGLAITRAQMALGRIDCPAPDDPAPRDGPSPLWDAAVNEATPGRIAAYYGGGGLALGTMILLVILAILRFDRIGRMKRRHACAIPVTLDDDQAAMALDLSREGIKIAVPGAAAPLAGQALTIRLGERALRATVRWGNAHVFGALFDTPLAAAELTELLRLSQTKPRIDFRRPRDRGAAAGPAGQDPETKDGTRGGAAKVAG